MFTQPFIQMQIQENIKALRHWPLCGEFTGEFPAQMASNAENFPFDDLMMPYVTLVGQLQSGSCEYLDKNWLFDYFITAPRHCLGG